MRNVFNFTNPLRQLGTRRYSFWIPFIASVLVILLSEIYVYSVAHNPMVVGRYIIFVHVAMIIYFSFRDGIKGGVITVVLAIAYYAYIIYTRNYSGEQLRAGIDATIVLSLLYSLLAGVIGWLKQTLDRLVGREKDERIRLQAIIDQLPVGVVITDSKGIVVEVNKKIDQFLGMKLPKGVKVGQTPLLETKQKGRTLTPSQGPLAVVLSTGKSVVDREVNVLSKDGKQVYLKVSAAPIHSHDGKLIAAASIVTDITQQKELEKRKDDFVNMASHELKTPITSMKLYMDSLQARVKSKDEKLEKILARLQYQTDNLQQLVSDLLDVSRIQTGKLTFHKEEFSLNELIKETIQGLQEAASTHTISFIAKDMVNVYADRFRIYQVLTNLLTNAIKYSPDGGAIKIYLKREKGKAIISVQDNGIGIPKEQHKKIFERLYQVTDPKEKTYPGLGMGLYISREIIKRHQGRIWVESEKDKGATFFVVLRMR